MSGEWIESDEARDEIAVGYTTKIEYRMRIEVTDLGRVVFWDYSPAFDEEGQALANWKWKFEHLQTPGGQRRIWREARTIGAWAEA